MRTKAATTQDIGRSSHGKLIKGCVCLGAGECERESEGEPFPRERKTRAASSQTASQIFGQHGYMGFS